MKPIKLAEKAAALILAKHDIAGHTVVLADYASEHDLHQVAGEFELTIEDHREALAHLSRLLDEAGARVEFQNISPEEYFLWLHREGGENTTEARAAFANLKHGQKKARL